MHMQAPRYHVPEEEQPAPSNVKHSARSRRAPQSKQQQAHTTSVHNASPSAPPARKRPPEWQSVQGQQMQAVDASMLRALHDSVVVPFIPVSNPDVVPPRGMSTTAGVSVCICLSI
jgi:hypothetical protein